LRLREGNKRESGTEEREERDGMKQLWTDGWTDGWKKWINGRMRARAPSPFDTLFWLGGTREN